MGKTATSRKGAIATPAAGRPARAKPVAAPDGTDPRQALAAWGFPLDFPSRLIFLPTRIGTYCAALGLATIGRLLDEVDRLGLDGLGD